VLDEPAPARCDAPPGQTRSRLPSEPPCPPCHASDHQGGPGRTPSITAASAAHRAAAGFAVRQPHHRKLSSYRVSMNAPSPDATGVSYQDLGGDIYEIADAARVRVGG